MEPKVSGKETRVVILKPQEHRDSVGTARVFTEVYISVSLRNIKVKDVKKIKTKNPTTTTKTKPKQNKKQNKTHLS